MQKQSYTFSYFKLILRSLVYYKRQNLTVFIGTLIAAAILTGGLITGDSVRYSLKQITESRLGNFKYALQGGERFFDWQLASRMNKQIAGDVVPVLQIKGIAIADGGKNRANSLYINGVDSLFWQSNNIELPALKNDNVFINKKLADKLQVKEGDEVLLRFENADVIPANAPFVSDTKWSVARRVTVIKVLDNNQFGRFSLRNKQVSPYNVFIDAGFLQRQTKLKGLSNIILVAPKNNLSIEKTDSIFTKSWTLKDANLNVNVYDSLQRIEITSERVFLDQPIVFAAESVHESAKKIITYFVNSIQKDTAKTPYSFVSAPGSPIVSKDMNDNEIIINRWLADDLNASTGDTLVLHYFVVGAMRKLTTSSKLFIVRQIVEIEGAAADRNLMPHFPGLSDAGNCRDWDTGIPIDLDAIRDKDEAYWDIYKGTPKAFITLNTARQMWQNRFGVYTAIRYNSEKVSKTDIAETFAKKFKPSALGLYFMPVYQQGIEAANNSVDFGELFLSLSFFIIFAAILLTAMLFSMNATLRSKESGILRSIGFSAKRIKQLLLVESVAIATLGAIFGSFAAIAYNEVILNALSEVWRGAVQTSFLLVDVQTTTLVIGTVSTIVVAAFAMYISIFRKKQHSITQLQQQQNQWQNVKTKMPVVSIVIALLAFVAVAILMAITGFKPAQSNTTVFFAAGGLLLVGFVAVANAFLKSILNKRGNTAINLRLLAYRNTARQAGRSLTVIALIAIGVFSVIATGANRKDMFSDAFERSSGTGGFAFWAETTMPILYNLDTEEADKQFGISDMGLDSVRFVQFRVLEGNDASCLNLNQIERPSILGVNPQELIKREAFSFVSFSDENVENAWKLLNREAGDDVIPAIADQTVITWGLKKQIGDTLFYKDEFGETIKLRLVAGLAGSVFQGNVIINEDMFMKHFPSVSGSKVMLIDAPKQKTEETAETLKQIFIDFGLDITPAAQRLAEFKTVENTYLSIFLALGGLGVILGTIGMGIVVLRNTVERQQEFAIMLSTGFKISHIVKMIFTENTFLLLSGTIAGLLSAVLATLPSLLAPSVSIPYSLIMIILSGIVLNGMLWIYLSARMPLSKKLIEKLRQE